MYIVERMYSEEWYLNHTFGLFPTIDDARRFRDHVIQTILKNGEWIVQGDEYTDEDSQAISCTTQVHNEEDFCTWSIKAYEQLYPPAPIKGCGQRLYLWVTTDDHGYSIKPISYHTGQGIPGQESSL